MSDCTDAGTHSAAATTSTLETRHARRMSHLPFLDWQAVSASSSPALSPSFRERPARRLLPDGDQSRELLDRFGVVVHLHANHRVVVEVHAAVLLDDEHRRRLLAAFVTTRRLARFERRQKPAGEVAGR